MSDLSTKVDGLSGDVDEAAVLHQDAVFNRGDEKCIASIVIDHVGVVDDVVGMYWDIGNGGNDGLDGEGVVSMRHIAGQIIANVSALSQELDHGAIPLGGVVVGISPSGSDIVLNVRYNASNLGSSWTDQLEFKMALDKTWMCCRVE